MAVKTQGTSLFVALPVLDSEERPTDEFQVVKVDCTLNINTGDDNTDEIDTTCLEADEATYIAGLRRPGNASFGLNSDPALESHYRIYLAKEGNSTDAYREILFAMGWSDGTDAPVLVTDSDGNRDFQFPATRTFAKFKGYVTAFPFDAQGNSVMKSTISVRKSGGTTWSRKSA